MRFIAILAALLLPALAKAKESAKRTSCLNNLKQMSLAWQMYADENNNNLPYNRDKFGQKTGYWPWDAGINVVTDAMDQSKEFQRNILYCPSFLEQNNKDLWLWTGQMQSPGHRLCPDHPVGTACAGNQHQLHDVDPADQGEGCRNGQAVRLPTAFSPPMPHALHH